jgi:hypothetical protein
MKITRMAFLWLLLPFFAQAADTPAAAPPWEQIRVEDGVVVWKRLVPGSPIVSFKSQGLIEAPVLDILAVIDDASHATEWMDSCVEATEIERPSASESIRYSVLKSPAFIVSDRDLLVRSHIRVDPPTRSVQARSEATSDPRKPPVEGRVRMPMLTVSWTLKGVTPGVTQVTYEVTADPGGSIPAWLVNASAKKMPFETLRQLRGQVGRDVYAARREQLARGLDWTGFTPAPAGASPAPAPAQTESD